MPLRYIPKPPEGWNWVPGGEPDWGYAWGVAERASDAAWCNMSDWACIDVTTASEQVSGAVGALLFSEDAELTDEGFLGDESYEIYFSLVPPEDHWHIVWRRGTVAGHVMAHDRNLAYMWAHLMDDLITATPTPSYKTVLVALSAIGVGLVLWKVT